MYVALNAMYSMLQDRTISVEKGKDRNVNFREKFRKNVCYVGVFCKFFLKFRNNSSLPSQTF